MVFSAHLKARAMPPVWLLALITPAALAQVTVLERVEVTGTPTLRNTPLVPGSHTVATEEWLRSRPVERIEELAAELPGVQAGVWHAGLASALVLRGFSVTRLNADGQPDLQRMHARDLSTVERIEMLRGPQAVLFGLGTPGGAVNYRLKAPVWTPLARVEVSSRFDTAHDGSQGRLAVDLGGPLGVADTAFPDEGPRLAYRLSIAAQDGHTGPARLTQRRHAILGALAWVQGDSRWTLTLDEQNTHQPFTFGTVITNDSPASGAVVDADVRHDQLYVQPGGAPAERRYHQTGLRWEHRLAPGTTLSADLRQAVVTRDETLIGFWSLDTPTTLSGYYTRYHDSYRQNNLALRLDTEGTFGPVQHRSSTGWSGHRQRLLFSGVQNIGGFTLDVASPDFDRVDPATLRVTPRLVREQAQDTSWWWGSRFTLPVWSPAHEFSAGWRHTRMRTWRATTASADLLPQTDRAGQAWQLGYAYALGAGTRLYTTASTGMEPSSGRSRDGDFLPPLTSRQTEIGLDAALRPGLQLRAAAFRVTLSNLPMTDPLDKTAKVAAGQRRVEGIEGALTARSATMAGGGRWQLTAHGQWLHSRYLVRPSASLGDELPGIAPWTAGLRLSRWLSGEAAARRGEVWLGVQALGTRFANPENTVRLPREAVAELGARVPLAEGPLLGIGVRNLFDRRHVQAVTALDDVYPGPRRQVWVSAQFELP